MPFQRADRRDLTPGRDHDHGGCVPGVYDEYNRYKTFYHGHTYTANPVACAAALASLGILAEDEVLSRAQSLMNRLQRETQRFRDLAIVGDVRGLGMVVAFEWVQDKASKESFADTRQVGLEIYRRGLAEGLVLRPLGNVTYLFLPLATTDGALTEILAGTYRALEAIKP